MPKTGLASYMIQKLHGNEAGNSSVHSPGVFLFFFSLVGTLYVAEVQNIINSKLIL